MLRVDQYIRDARGWGISESVAVSVLMLNILQEMRQVIGDDGITRAVTRARHDLAALQPERKLKVMDG